jgi:prepilin-type N-terminal cleavage/methylation domain-containing protein
MPKWILILLYKLKSTRDNQYGFSLLEILISITVLSFITIAITAFTENSISTAIKVTSEDNESLQIETAMARLEWDISQLYSPLYFDHAMDPQGLTQTEGEIYNKLADHYQSNARFSMLSFTGLPIPVLQNSDKTTLILFTSSNRRKIKNAKQSHFAWVKYELESEDLSKENEDRVAQGLAEIPGKTNKLIRKIYTKDIYNKDEVDWDDVKSQVLMHKIISLKYEFWNPKTKKWVASLDLIKDGSNIIYGIRLLLQYLDPSSIEVSTVRVFRPLYPSFTPENMYDFLKPKATEPNPAEGGASE